MNVLHYLTSPGLAESEPDPNDVAAAIWGAIGESYLFCLSPGLTVDVVRLVEERVDSAVPLSGEFTVGLAGTNGAGGHPQPIAATMVLRKRTGVAKRYARGWMLLAFHSVADNTEDEAWSSGALSTAGSLAEAMTASFEIGSIDRTGCGPVVYSRKQHLLGHPSTFAIRDVSPQPRIHWLRSRTTTP